jgi:ABC-type branched-subunit amino acid transport system substrate-binding protein
MKTGAQIMRCKILLSIFVLLLIVFEALVVSPCGAREKTAATDRFIIKNEKNTVVTNEVDHHAIGCVLPLTGRHAAAGNKALDAIILAAGIFDKLKKSPFTLVIEDSKSEPDAARAAVSKLAREKVLCILGPLGSTEAVAAAEEAQRLKIPIITLTQKERITHVGDYVFRNYMTNEMQMERLVAYAVEEMELIRFAVLYPDDHYGREMERLFRDEVMLRKIKTIKSKSYHKSQVDFGDVIKAVTVTKEMPSGKERVEKSDNEHTPGIDFDALFIPDTSARISMIIPQLAYYNVKGVKLLGTSIWNSVTLVKTAGEHIDGAVFADGFCLNTFYPEANAFIDIFYTNYGREPDVMDALVYAAARMVVKTIEEYDAETREQFKQSLLKLKSYRGVTGYTSFSGTRDAHKSLFILTVKDGQIIQIK